MSGVKPLLKMRSVWYMPIKSSSITECAFDLKRSTLYLVFKGSEKFVYVYTDVNYDWWVKFTQSKSKGSFFQKQKMKLINFTKERLLNEEEYKLLKKGKKTSRKKRAKK